MMQRVVVKHTDLITLDVASMKPTAGAVIAVKTNADIIVSFIESARCEETLTAKGTRCDKIAASHSRGSGVVAIRVGASTDSDALKAASAVLGEVEKFTDRHVQVVRGPTIVQ